MSLHGSVFAMFKKEQECTYGLEKMREEKNRKWDQITSESQSGGPCGSAAFLPNEMGSTEGGGAKKRHELSRIMVTPRAREPGEKQEDQFQSFQNSPDER